MIEKKGKKIWIYVGVGVFLVIVGMVSWGVATDWKFFGDSKKSGGSGPSPPPPPPPSEDPCDPTKCKKCSSDKKKCMLCYDGYTLNDGICVCQDENKKSNNCCPKGYTRDNTSSCCQNNTLTTTGDCCDSPVCPFGNMKVCCDGVDQKCDNDGKGCYIQCGSEKCYNGGKCVDDGNGQRYCENKDCQWGSIPSTNPSYISDITIKNFPECGDDNPKCTKNSNGTYTLNTTGITTIDNGEPMNDSQGNPYTFIYKPSYSKNMLPTKYKMVSEITAPITPGTKCDTDDCNNILNIFGNGTITNNMNGNQKTCKMLYDSANVMDFPDDPKCPFENDTTKGRGNPALRCCPGVNVETTSGQICTEGTVGAMKNAKEEDGLIFECVSVDQCVDDNGKICGGNGICQYDSTLNDGKGGGKCVCNPDKNYYKYSGKYCKQAPDYDACKKDFSPYVIKTDFWGNVYPPICGDHAIGGPACVGSEGDPGSCCAQNDGYCDYTIGCNSGNPDVCRQCYKDRGCGGTYENLVLKSGITTLNKIKKLIQNIKGKDNIENLNNISNVINTEIGKIGKIDTTKFDKLKNVSILPLLNDIIKNKVTSSDQIKTMFKTYINNK
jgi:hypothetical protein